MKGSGEMAMVPFLTVLKGDEVVDTISLEGRDTLIMGRHHSCDLVVGHASSSRRHLEIQIVHSTRDVILTDLGSVHGTWVSGTRLDFMTPVVFNGSVTFQLAASTRIYRLDWQPVADDPDPIETFLPLGELATNQELSSQTHSRSSQSGLRQMSENQDFGGKSNSSGHQSKGGVGGEKAHISSTWQPQQQQDENLSPAVLNSPGQGKFGGQVQRATTPVAAVASSPKLPMRRLAFASLQASTKQLRPPTSSSSPSVKRSGLMDRSAAQQVGQAKSSSAFTDKVFSSPSKQQQKIGATSEISTPSKLWLRRGSSAPLPALTTIDATDNKNNSNNKVVPSAPPLTALREDCNISIDPSSSSSSAVSEKTTKNVVISKFDVDEREYPSDKENVDPVRLPYKPRGAALKSKECLSSTAMSKDSSSCLVETIERQPFQPLFNPLPCPALGYKGIFQSTADSYGSSEDFNPQALTLPRPQQKHCPTAENLDQLLRRLKLADSIEGRKQWHAVIDTNCLLDSESLKALKQLEGIKEVSVIIPKIVVRELDFLKHREGLKSSAREALRWIESCMLRLPNWIHVQKWSETLPVGATPPPSPSGPFPQRGDLMSPTNDDHILECAMLFDMTTPYGKVALLTRDTALRIKAMSEGLLSESAVEFVESLLSPYSNRFLWAGSTAHGKTWVDSPLHSPVYSGESTGRLKSHSHINHPVEDLRNHISAQPRGLRVVVSQ